MLEMVDYFYDVDERDVMFFYRVILLDKVKFFQVLLCVFGFVNFCIKQGEGGDGCIVKYLVVVIRCNKNFLEIYYLYLMCLQ